MTTRFDRNVKTIPEAIQTMLGFATDIRPSGSKPPDDAYLWFRGINADHLNLRPGAVWRTGYVERPPLVELAQRSGRFYDSGEIGNWDTWGTYYAAQHYGVPTRLLDWTESFMAALFFAFDGAKKDSHPCVWVMDPSAFNHAVCGYEGIVSPENNPELNIWLPGQVEKVHEDESHDDPTVIYRNNLPLAIYPRHGNSRIRSQDGFFTIHGRSREPIENVVLIECPDPDKVLIRIRFECSEVDPVKESLGLLGVRRSTIYPDLGSYVTELKETYGWGKAACP